MGNVGYELVAAARARRAHRERLRLLGCPAGPSGALVVPFAEPMVYCLPGRRPTVVLTSAAVAALTSRQLRAALAHEHAHIRQRHHLALGLAAGLQRAMPFPPLFRRARAEITLLIELAADDAAAHRHGRRALAEAVVAVAAPETTTRGLGAGGVSALHRVRRLARADAPLGRLRLAAAMALAVVLLTGPALLALAPLGHAAGAHHCASAPADGIDPDTAARIAV
ncbi:M56 family metallopeptidase [Embleya sp. NPDC059237]|uniref:M56 family metallopeptidase n=1 Tax=Embleya sp. NPDC059237 TaxID=3346784 RepID=UPI00369E0E68